MTECPRCKWTWNYSGKASYAQCPKCLYKIRFNKRQKPSAPVIQQLQTPQYPDIIITSDIDDLWLDTAQPYNIPGYWVPLFKGRRKRDVPQGMVVESEIKKTIPKQERDTTEEQVKFWDTVDSLDEDEKQQKEPADFAEAVMYGTDDQFIHALLKAKLNKLMGSQ